MIATNIVGHPWTWLARASGGHQPLEKNEITVNEALGNMTRGNLEEVTRTIYAGLTFEAYHG